MPLQRTSEQNSYSASSATSQDNDPTKRSKKVPQRVRQSTFKDKQTLAKISAFRVPAELLAGETSVAHPTPSIPTIPPLTSPSTDTPKASNDNHHIPVWALTGDVVKAVAATAALQIAEKPAHAFTFNLTRKAEANALTHPRGFLDSLKRSFDKQLAKASIRLPYWFAIDISREGRLHIHGAFSAVTENVILKQVMWKAWGEWPGRGKQFQIDIRPLRNDGWATYVLYGPDQRRVAKRIGRSFTMTRPLQRDAEWTYSEIRRIMRAPAKD